MAKLDDNGVMSRYLLMVFLAIALAVWISITLAPWIIVGPRRLAKRLWDRT